MSAAVAAPSSTYTHSAYTVGAAPAGATATTPTQIAGDTSGTTPTPRAQQTFTAAKTAVKTGEKLEVRFAAPMIAVAGEKFWITIVAKDAAEGSYASWFYLTQGQRTATMTAPTTAGDYEIRLHANYPTKPYNIVHRQALQVTD